MRRLDFYVQHMIKQSAQGIVMRSGDPVEFRFGPGKIRRSNQPITHKQILQLLREVAPPEVGEQIRLRGAARFSVKGQPGADPIYLAVTATSAECFRVVISGHEIDASYDEPILADDPTAAPSGEEWDGFGRGPAPDLQEPPPRAQPLSPAHKPPSLRPPTAQPAFAPKPSPAAQPPGPPAGQAARTAARGGSPQGEARMQRYLRTLLAARGSDLHLSTGSEAMMRVDGEIRIMEGSQGPLKQNELLDMMLAIVPPEIRRTYEDTHDADFAYEIEGLGRFRFNYFLDRRGPGLVARQIPFEILTPEQLGLPPAVIDLCWLSKGLVLVTGPTGSGKSTTLASLVDFINRNRSEHIITIEDPIEFVHPNKRCLVNQRQVGMHTGSFSHALRAALREDPDVIVVGEMRDLETISIAIETAETGHLVFGTLHTTTAPSTVDRIIDQFPADRQSQIRAMLAESLRGVISQVLCKKPGGGRAGAYEVLLVNNAAQNVIREGKTFQLKSLMQTARAQGMQTMNDHLFELVKTNTVDVKDAYVKATDKQGFKEMLVKGRINLDPALFRGD